MNSALTTWAGQINAAHQQAIQHADKAIEFAKQAGALLIEVKASLPHGEFIAWVEQNCTVSARQAQRYMAAAQGKPMPMRAIKNDTASHLDAYKPDAPEIDLSLGSVGLAQWIDAQGNHCLFEAHSFLFPDEKTIGLKCAYMVGGARDDSGAFVEYDRRGMDASFLGLRARAGHYHVPLEKLIVSDGLPMIWNSMHEMDQREGINQ